MTKVQQIQKVLYLEGIIILIVLQRLYVICVEVLNEGQETFEIHNRNVHGNMVRMDDSPSGFVFLFTFSTLSSDGLFYTTASSKQNASVSMDGFIIYYEGNICP